MTVRNHGTVYAYKTHGCRCPACRTAHTAASRRDHANRKARQYQPVHVDHDLLADLLHELAPFGLTEDCPARRACG